MSLNDIRFIQFLPDEPNAVYGPNVYKSDEQLNTTQRQQQTNPNGIYSATVLSRLCLAWNVFCHRISIDFTRIINDRSSDASIKITKYRFAIYSLDLAIVQMRKLKVQRHTETHKYKQQTSRLSVGVLCFIALMDEFVVVKCHRH